MMDYLLIILGACCILIGIAGSVLPVLPGPPISYLGLLLMHFTDKYQFSTKFLIIWAAISVATVLLDQLIPVWGTKKFGGSKQGVWGSVIGLLIGMIFLGPPGIIIGPFLGAVAGELIAGKRSSQALRAGTGALLGFLAGTILKLVVSGMMCWYFMAKLIY
ncbi:DUF456 domain-containing protein [Mangrovibacterium diazotrophicum]|uniref:DUF456 domain-containing protein n=1 Tax=Mangrovibacterium diazotrophicum TaxID=1261403 RepID=A0A419W3V2_9BACT|nr:DUF456 domain-containing protein [Mangrovibacterium diazotrophicum]RKD90114.1 hypothetical protein BC643_0450 [Mangrovibacterium diazotrophicum]